MNLRPTNRFALSSPKDGTRWNTTSDTSARKIAKRGREYEKTMGIDFLLGLNELYEEWIKQYPGRLLIVDGDTMKFESDPEAFGYITEQIDRRLFEEPVVVDHPPVSHPAELGGEGKSLPGQ